MNKSVCIHCGSALLAARVVRTTEDGYEYLCDACAVGERADLEPSTG